MASTKSKKSRKGLAVALAVLGVAGLSLASALAAHADGHARSCRPGSRTSPAASTRGRIAVAFARAHDHRGRRLPRERRSTPATSFDARCTTAAAKYKVATARRRPVAIVQETAPPRSTTGAADRHAHHGHARQHQQGRRHDLQLIPTPPTTPRRDRDGHRPPHPTRPWLRRVWRAAVSAMRSGSASRSLGVLLWPTSLGGCTTLTIVSGQSMEPTYFTGDLVVARCGAARASADVVVYEPPELGGGRIIHRLVGRRRRDRLAGAGRQQHVGRPVRADRRATSWASPACTSRRSGMFGTLLATPCVWVLAHRARARPSSCGRGDDERRRRHGDDEDAAAPSRRRRPTCRRRAGEPSCRASGPRVAAARDLGASTACRSGAAGSVRLATSRCQYGAAVPGRERCGRWLAAGPDAAASRTWRRRATIASSAQAVLHQPEPLHLADRGRHQSRRRATTTSSVVVSNVDTDRLRRAGRSCVTVYDPDRHRLARPRAGCVASGTVLCRDRHPDRRERQLHADRGTHGARDHRRLAGAGHLDPDRPAGP